MDKQFKGYEQHDSQELICFILDKIHEDLNRIKKKPIVEAIEKEKDELDFETARRAWIGYKRRNHSIIVDLMFGQLRSKLTCPRCKHTSVTFDPFNFVTLPLPKGYRKELKIFFIRKGFTQAYRYTVILTDKSQAFSTVHEEIESKFNVPKERIASGLLSFSSKGEMISPTSLAYDMYKKCKSEKEKVHVFAFELTENELEIMRDPQCIYGYTFFSQESPKYYYESKKKIVSFVRPFFFKKNTTGFEMYRTYFEYLKAPLKLGEKGKENYSDEELLKFFLTDPPFNVKIKKVTEGSSSIFWSSKPKETEEPVLIRDPEWVFEKKVTTSVSKADGKAICEIEVLFGSISRLPLEKLSSCETKKREENEESKESGKHSLKECFSAFQQPEVLDEMNTWYCRSCKDHVRAQKELRLYKVPEILIIQLKRFKEKDSSHSYFQKSVNTKISTKIQFPLEGFNVSEFVISKESPDADYRLTNEEIFGPGSPEKPQASKISHEEFLGSKRELTYDLYAVSNHYGSMSYGHYTAYILSDGKWYEMDDLKISKIDQSHVVSEAAYVLFYRRREAKNKK